FIYRQSLHEARPQERHGLVRRYVEVVGRQELLDTVEYFLTALVKSTDADQAPTKALPAELAAFLSRMRIDAAKAGAPNALLDEFVAARNQFVRRWTNATAHENEIHRLNEI